MSRCKVGQIEVFFNETRLKQRELRKKMRVSTQNVSVIRKKLIAIFNWVRKGSEGVDENEKPLGELIDKL